MTPDDSPAPEPTLRQRLATMRADLIATLETRIDGGCLALLANVQTSIAAPIDAHEAQRDHI